MHVGVCCSSTWLGVILRVNRWVQVHMLGDEQRGSILESLCTKLLFHSVGAAASGPMAASAGEGIQVLSPR